MIMTQQGDNLPSQRLPVALVGLGAFGRLALEALLASDLVEVVGIADRDAAVVAEVAGQTQVPAYTDNRSLLAEARPAATYLTVPPSSCQDLIFACAERSIHVWKAPPLARNLTEGVAAVRRMENAGLKLAVGTQRRFTAGYRRAWELRREVGQLFLARGHYLFNWGTHLGWRGDKTSAGGGALLELGYHCIDLLVWMLGLPEGVYGLIAGGGRGQTHQPPDTSQPVYDTDDTAAAVLRYPGPLIADIVTTRCSGPVSEDINLHGRTGSLTANSEMCLLRDADGNVLDQIRDDCAPGEIFRRQVDAFARAVLTGATTYECSGWENLLNLAVIDAIYLSDQTAQPEIPHRLLETHGLTVDECMELRPAEQQLEVDEDQLSETRPQADTTSPTDPDIPHGDSL